MQMPDQLPDVANREHVPKKRRLRLRWRRSGHLREQDERAVANLSGVESADRDPGHRWKDLLKRGDRGAWIRRILMDVMKDWRSERQSGLRLAAHRAGT